MILLLGGTSESAPLAEALLGAGHRVLVSTATDAPLALPAAAARRCGRMDVASMVEVIRRQGVSVVVDATHPYAAVAHQTAIEAAARARVCCLRWVRAAVANADMENLRYAANHEEAAEIACRAGRVVLLTTGSRNLAPYVRQAVLTGCQVVARVLPEAESLKACREAGMAEENVIAVRGPFSLDANLALIRERRIDVIVSKESGEAGGQAEKVEAARQSGCTLVLVRRPDESNALQAHTVAELLDLVGSCAERA